MKVAQILQQLGYSSRVIAKLRRERITAIAMRSFATTT